MGTSGPAIFSDDLACDIRSEFRELIGDGLTAQEATDQLIAEYTKSGTPTDPEEGPTFWIALAATQWKCGRLLESVKAKALASIDVDLQRWHASVVGNPSTIATLFARRKQVLDEFRSQLNSPQPKTTKIRKAFREHTDWEIGYLVSYRLLSGHLIVFRVIGIMQSDRSRIALCDIANWSGEALPPAVELAHMSRRRDKRFDPVVPFEREHNGKMALYSLKAADFPADRLFVIAKNQPVVATDGIGASYFGGWSALDHYLDIWFGLR